MGGVAKLFIAAIMWTQIVCTTILLRKDESVEGHRALMALYVFLIGYSVYSILECMCVSCLVCVGVAAQQPSPNHEPIP